MAQRSFSHSILLSSSKYGIAPMLIHTVSIFIGRCRPERMCNAIARAENECPIGAFCFVQGTDDGVCHPIILVRLI